MSLTVCLLTRDAEKTLGRALRSTADLGAELIVADTGSRDRTMELAQAAGAKVITIVWQDDFGAAQNQALAQATGDWVLWLNPDEEVLPGQRAKLAALLARTDAFAYAVHVQEVMHADRPGHATETLSPRLFRRHPDVRYVGRLHPYFATPLDEIARRQNQHLLHADLSIRHHAYESVLTEEKLRWAARLMELELRDRPGQLHYLIEYGRTLLRLNDPRGHQVLVEAAEKVLTASAAPHAPTPTVASLLEYLLTVSPQQSCSRLTLEQARGLALRWFPASPPLLWALAQRAFQNEDFRDAAQLLETLVQIGANGTYDRSAAFDPSIMRDAAFVNLGNCNIKLGDLDRAEWWFGQALASPTHAAQARQGYATVQNLHREKSAD